MVVAFDLEIIHQRREVVVKAEIEELVRADHSVEVQANFETPGERR